MQSVYKGGRIMHAPHVYSSPWRSYLRQRLRQTEAKRRQDGGTEKARTSIRRETRHKLPRQSLSCKDIHLFLRCNDDLKRSCSISHRRCYLPVHKRAGARPFSSRDALSVQKRNRGVSPNSPQNREGLATLSHQSCGECKSEHQLCKQ